VILKELMQMTDEPNPFPPTPKIDKRRGIVYFFCRDDLPCEECFADCPFAGPREPFDCDDCGSEKSMEYIGHGTYMCSKCGYWI